jgi:hypothetical protein
MDKTCDFLEQYDIKSDQFYYRFFITPKGSGSRFTIGLNEGMSVKEVGEELKKVAEEMLAV